MAYNNLDEINGKVLTLAQALVGAIRRDTGPGEIGDKGKVERTALLKYLDAAAKAAVANIQQLTAALKTLYNQAKTVFTRMEEIEKRLKNANYIDPRDIDSLEKMHKTIVQFQQNTSRTLSDFERAEDGYCSGEWISVLEGLTAEVTVREDGQVKKVVQKVEDVRAKGKACRLMAGRIEATFAKLSTVASRVGDYAVRGERMTAAVEKMMASADKKIETEMKLIARGCASATEQQGKFFSSVVKFDETFKKIYMPIVRKDTKEYKLKDVNEVKKLKSLMESERRSIAGTIKAIVSVDIEGLLENLKELSAGAATSAQADLKKKLVKVQTDFKKLQEKWDDNYDEMYKDCLELLKIVDKHSKENALKKKERT